MARLKKGHYLFFACRWFNRSTGNTYHSCSVYHNNVFLDRIDYVYGYGDSYKQTGLEILQKHGHFKKTGKLLKSGMNKDQHDFEMQMRKDYLKILFLVVDVDRKKDL